MMSIITTISTANSTAAAAASAATSSNCFNLSNCHFYPEVSSSSSSKNSNNASSAITASSATTTTKITSSNSASATTASSILNSHQIPLPSIPFRSQSSNHHRNSSLKQQQQQQRQFYQKHFPSFRGVGFGSRNSNSRIDSSLSNYRQHPHNPNFHPPVSSSSSTSNQTQPQRFAQQHSYRNPSNSSSSIHGHHRIKPSMSNHNHHHHQRHLLAGASSSSSAAYRQHPSSASASSHHHHQSNHHHHHHHYSYHQPSMEDYHSFISPCVKYSLFFFNLIFWLIGAVLMSLGCWSLLEEYDEYNLLKFRNIFEFLLHISLSLMLAGFVIFSMSFTGCLGALRENLCLIKLYSLMLLLLFVAEVILSSLAFIFPNTLSHFLKDRLSKDLITKYRDDTNLQNLIDIVQMEFKCCGVSDNGFKDWSKNIYFNCNGSNPSSERCAVPFSCCRNSNTGLINIMCGYNMQNLSSVVEVNKYVYTRGCVEAISELVERNMNLVAGICLGSALAQLFAMFLARSLQGQIFAQRARWM